MAATENEYVTGSLTFHAGEKYVQIEWDFKPQGGDPSQSYDRVTVSYEPTAVCRKAGVSPIFYVVGYVWRTDQVVVEQWELTNMLLGTAIGPGGATTSTFGYTIRKDVLASTTSIQPIADAVYNRYADKLWLLEAESPKVLWQCDPATGNTTWLADQTTLVALGVAKSMWGTKIVGAALPGYIIVLKPTYPWEEGDVDSPNLFLMRDANLDGTMDEALQMTWEQYDQRGYWENEAANYP